MEQKKNVKNLVDEKATRQDGSQKNSLPPLSRKFGFTLAEVLITLGVIGIVAAMTIPTLVSNYQEKATIAKVKKFYSDMSHACKLAVVENGPINEWGLTAHEPIDDENSKYMASDKTYESIDKFINIISQYLKSTYVPIRGLRTEDGGQLEGGLFLNDGLTLNSVYIVPYNCTTPNDKRCVDIYIKTDRADDEIAGKNYFCFQINADGSVEAHGFNRDFFDKYCKSGSNRYVCTGWLLKYENMDYLKCPEELDWNGKHKCSD